MLSSPLLTGGTLYIGSNDGHVYGIDRASGRRRWRFEIGAWVASSPAVSGTAW